MRSKPPASSPTPTRDARQAAFQTLRPFEMGKNRSLKAEALIDATLRHAALPDPGFYTALVYGVLRHWFLLEGLIATLTDLPPKKIQPEVRLLLRLGLFQLARMDGVPDYAAVDATVTLAKALRLSRKTTGFINGVLRGYLRRRDILAAPDWQTEPAQHLQAVLGLPAWFAQRLLAQYPADTVHAMAQSLQAPPALTLRVNTLKTSVADYRQQLDAAQIPHHPTADVAECLVLEGFVGSPTALPGYAEGRFLVQDASAAQVSHVLQPEPDAIVVDLCAAPGGKTTHLAALMQNQGRIFAVEASEKRAVRLRENLQRLGVENTTVHVTEAQGFTLPDGLQADAVLVDAPCSGLGTVHKHPEILVQRRASDLAQYPPLQLALLEKALALVKPGGVIVYSTCSLEATENQDVVKACLKRHSGLMRLESETQRPITAESDGFYIARLLRR